MRRKVYHKKVGFFIEFRLHGYANAYAKWIKKHLNNRGVAHITLFGPAKTHDLNRVITKIIQIGQNYSLIPLNINGFSRFDHINNKNKVIYLEIDPSHLLEEFRRELAKNLLNVSETVSPWDDTDNYKFHSTVKIFKSISDSKFNELFDHVNNHCRLKDYERFRKWHKITLIENLLSFLDKFFGEPEDTDKNIGQYLLRITIIGKRSRILYEYDLVLKKLLNRKEALSRYWWRRTINKFRELQSQP